MSIQLKIFFISIFVLIIIFISVIIYVLRSGPPQDQPSEQIPQPTRSPLFISPTDIPIPSIVNRSVITTLMPVRTNEFTIEYLYASETFIITITQSPYEANKQKAEQWFRDRGISNLDTINILYNKSILVQ